MLRSATVHPTPATEKTLGHLGLQDRTVSSPTARLKTGGNGFFEPENVSSKLVPYSNLPRKLLLGTMSHRYLPIVHRWRPKYRRSFQMCRQGSPMLRREFPTPRGIPTCRRSFLMPPQGLLKFRQGFPISHRGFPKCRRGFTRCLRWFPRKCEGARIIGNEYMKS